MQRRRGSTKIPRNAPCPCGGGKKYKHCHGNIERQNASPSPSFDENILRLRAQEIMRQHEAAEKVRQEQQGYGHPIISWKMNNTRIVAVKNTVWWPPPGKKWIYFPDFLFDYLKKTLGHDWGAKAKRDGLPHPLFRWLEKIGRYQMELPGNAGRPIVGYVSCVFHLSYALYQLAHNDTIPGKLLNRLRSPLNFFPAFYEIVVGAALAVAGMEIESAEKTTTHLPTPEFHVKSKRSGTTYDVEAKRKAGWTASTDDLKAEEFKRELAGYVRDQIHKAAKKRLKNTVLWIELSIPTIHGEAEWRALMAHVNAVMDDAKTMTVDGKAIGCMFVVITNITFMVNEDVAGDPSFASLHALNISDFPMYRSAALEELLEGYDKYRDVFAMMEGWRVGRAIPPTFDGTPGEFVAADGTVTRPIKIGDRVVVPGLNGQQAAVIVDELVSQDDKMSLFVRNEATDQAWMIEMPLTEAEARAASQYTDAVFGKDNVSRPLRQDDPFDLYDWFLKGYARTTPAQLDKLMEGPEWEPYRHLSPEEKRKRIARNYTKAAWIQSHPEKKPVPE